MPCYNAAPYVEEAMSSALSQSYGNVELIVTDDGSTDASVQIIEKVSAEHPGQVTLVLTRHVGPFPARNVALRHARGGFVAFLDADDWWEPTTLEKLHAAVEDENADISYCGWQNVGKTIRTEPYIPPEYEKNDPVDSFMRSCPWPIHAALIKKSIVDQLGGFSVRRYSAMDYDFWLRVLATTRRMVRVPEVLAYYRWHGTTQVSAVKWRQVLDALDAQKCFINQNSPLVAHISADRLRDLTEGQVLRKAYQAFWNRDLTSAQMLFRHAAAARSFRLSDLRHIISALLPMPAYRWLVNSLESEET
jgi:GT2 family glycosyltransferase